MAKPLQINLPMQSEGARVQTSIMTSDPTFSVFLPKCKELSV